MVPPVEQLPEPPEVTPWAWSPESQAPPESPPSRAGGRRGEAVHQLPGVVDRDVLGLDGAAAPAGRPPGAAHRRAGRRLGRAGDRGVAAGVVVDPRPRRPVGVGAHPGVVVAGERRARERALGDVVVAERGAAGAAAVSRGDEAAVVDREADRAQRVAVDDVLVAAADVVQGAGRFARRHDPHGVGRHPGRRREVTRRRGVADDRHACRRPGRRTTRAPTGRRAAAIRSSRAFAADRRRSPRATSTGRAPVASTALTSAAVGDARRRAGRRGRRTRRRRTGRRARRGRASRPPARRPRGPAGRRPGPGGQAEVAFAGRPACRGRGRRPRASPAPARHG